jgi:enoyl-CoA hydratase/carnithine racemase
MSAVTATSPEPLVLNRGEEGVVRLTLNRGSRTTAVARDDRGASEELDSIAADPEARVVVLGADGKGFSAGHDLKEMRAHAGDEAWQLRLFDDCSRMMVSLTRMPQPVIARVHGIATAAGCQLVSMCDLAVAADTTTFAMPGINVGVFCSTPAVGVARNVGRKRAMEMLLTGEPINAQTALAWGLSAGRPGRRARLGNREFTAILLARSPRLSGSEGGLPSPDRAPLDAAYDTTGETWRRTFPGRAAEGIDAFLGKRPHFRGHRHSLSTVDC